jgi:1,2-phenylacetyl-CoA epoxidase catalytic subunit
MSNFLSAYSIQSWLESCPQGYLMGTVYGHEPGEKEPDFNLDNEMMREDALRTTTQLVLGERCALAASSGLINCAPDYESKHFLATQTLDEARHVEIFTQRMYDLGVKKEDLESTLKHFGNPNLVKFAEVLLEKVDKKDFIAGVVGQNIVLEGMAFSVFEMLKAVNENSNKKFAHVLAGTIADERRHVGFGENRIGSLIREHPERKPEIEQMQKDMTYHMLATFAEAFRDREATYEEARKLTGANEAEGVIWHGANLTELEPMDMEHVLADTVLKEFKTRLGRIGLEYQSPARPKAA